MELMGLSTKVCSKCGIEKDSSLFNKNRLECKECESSRKKLWREKNKDKLHDYEVNRSNKEARVEYGKIWRANRRKYKWFTHYTKNKEKYVRSLGIPWDLDEEYLKSIWVDVCPVLGFPLINGSHLIGNDRPDNLAELDRLIPAKGYIKGNVRWISRRANRIKSDASVEELEKIVAYMKDNGCE